MRFLLHRQQPAVIAARRLQKEVQVVSANANVEQPQGCSLRRAWGQQCSPNCGCVVRFEATINDESKRIEFLSYHAKTLVTKKTTKTTNAARASTTTEQTPELQVVLTSKGRPMTKACECTAVHQLCHSIIDNVPRNSSLSSVKNMLEFNSHRSSTAFARSALLAQDLSPTKQQHCFDVVEEALTAVVKGHLPKPRQQQFVAPPRPTREHELPDYNWPPSREAEEDDEYDESFPSFFPPPGQESTNKKDQQNEAMRTSHVGQFFFWNKDNHDGDYGYEEVIDNESTQHEVNKAASSKLRSLSSSSSPFSSPVQQQEGPSTLHMFDLNLIKEEEEKRRRSRMNLSSQQDNKSRKLDLAMRPPPRDWVSYVDEQLYHQEQHHSMNGRGKAQEASA